MKGLLSVSKPLDYEQRTTYRVLVLATVLGDLALATYTTVNITVSDINDNPPAFKVSRHHIKVSEDALRGQPLLVVRLLHLQ